MTQTEINRVVKISSAILAGGLMLSIVPTKSDAINFLIVAILSGVVAYQLLEPYILYPDVNFYQNPKKNRNQMIIWLIVFIIIGLGLWSIRHHILSRKIIA